MCQITEEVREAIVGNLWEYNVCRFFPTSEETMMEMILEMEREWQFPFAFSAPEGCYTPIRCPAGGPDSQKEHHNFKNFYSIVLMALVDASYRFIWASSGWAGNTHDSTIFQAKKLFRRATDGAFKLTSFDIEGVNVGPLVLGGGAFLFLPLLQKPYSNSSLTKEESNFNYRLSRVRMFTEAAFGVLKGWWRILHRKCELTKHVIKIYSLACIVLHNICIENGDTMPRLWDINVDDISNQRRPSEEVRELLMMRTSRTVPDRHFGAEAVRDALKKIMGRKPNTDFVLNSTLLYRNNKTG